MHPLDELEDALAVAKAVQDFAGAASQHESDEIQVNARGLFLIMYLITDPMRKALDQLVKESAEATRPPPARTA